ncbi:MAG: TIGR02588 family protein [Kastovskya adunca ATA6-11-RM4]|jgi:uncharacterized protein (TIGR02588 family)|nr:TIGR02588 family protein [Kastovskya adunca ATA6-11-RM4]
MKNTDSSPEVEQESQRSPAEWISFFIALSILAVVVGLVVYKWFTQSNEPPVIVVQPGSEIREEPGQFYLPFSITNKGGETVESVQLIAEFRINGEVEESGEQQIDFLASGETEEGAFVFSRHPREGELTMRVASYKSP